MILVNSHGILLLRARRPSILGATRKPHPQKDTYYWDWALEHFRSPQIVQMNHTDNFPARFGHHQ